MNLTQEERQSLLFYQGSVQGNVLGAVPNHLHKFYAAEEGYQILDMLLFPGTESEKVRLQIERRYIDTMFLNNMAELLNVYCNLFSAMCRYTNECESKQDMHLYRKDRILSWECLKKGQISTFFSTSQKSKIAAYFTQNKYGILLEEILVSEKIVHLKVNDVLGKYHSYASEEEVLLPPFLKVHCEDAELTEEEKHLRDCCGRSPIKKCLVYVEELCLVEDYDEMRQKDIHSQILEYSHIENAKNVWKKIQSNIELFPEEEKDYCVWKKWICDYLRTEYGRIMRENNLN